MIKKKVIRVVLSSPGDVNSEHEKVTSVVKKINKSIADEKGFNLELFRWEKDSIPGLHNKGPQAIIDPLMEINKSDLWIGLLWKRFGTPTMGSFSGTQHEFKSALKSWKSKRRPYIMLYTKSRKHNPKNRREKKQAKRVERFIRKFPTDKGMLSRYASIPAFEEKLFEHLTRYVKHYDDYMKEERQFQRKHLLLMIIMVILVTILAYLLINSPKVVNFFINVHKFITEI